MGVCKRKGCLTNINNRRSYCNTCLQLKFKIISEMEKKGETKSRRNMELYSMGFVFK